MGRRGGGRWGEAEDEAFLRALATLGHVGEAAKAIGWGESSAHRRRQAHAGFRARWTALAARPPCEAYSLTVRDDPPRDGRGGPRRVRKRNGWTPAVEAEFLAVLASSCNVRLAAERAGICSSTAYLRRREHADFDRRWQAALAQGHARIEIDLVRAAAESIEGVEFGERAIGPVSAETALRLLTLHRNEVRGRGRRPGRRPDPPRIEEVRADILRRAAAIRAARALPAS